MTGNVMCEFEVWETDRGQIKSRPKGHAKEFRFFFLWYEKKTKNKTNLKVLKIQTSENSECHFQSLLPFSKTLHQMRSKWIMQKDNLSNYPS